MYRYPQIHEKEISKQISDILKQGIIKKNNSPYNSPLWIVPKKADNSGQKKWRIVIDYRKLNEVTVDDKFPIPNIETILDKLDRAQYFTTLDIAKGFHQILVREEDRKKTAFSTPQGHYEYIRMPFGLKTAPETEYLGHILTPEEVRPNPKKIEDIRKLKLPETQKLIKSFLGMSDYYRKFIRDYAKVAQPITQCLKKNVKVDTNDSNYINSFEKLKKLVTETPILKYPDFNKKFKLVTNASQYAIGAVLQQDSHPVCFVSRTLNEHERKYSATEKELLAIVWSTNYFRPYLYGVKFDLLTDHQPSKWLHSKTQGKDLNPRLYRWLLKLGKYNINIDSIKDKFSKFATAYYLEDRNNQTIIEKLREYKSQRGHFKKLVTDNEFCSVNIKDYLRKENIELNLVKPNSHTGNSDIERLHNTLSEKIRMLGIENKDLNIKEKIFRALEWYNNSYHSTTREKPINIQEEILRENQNIQVKLIFKMLLLTIILTFCQGHLTVEKINTELGYSEIKLDNVKLVKTYDTILHIVNIEEISNILNTFEANLKLANLNEKENTLQFQVQTIRTKLQTLVPHRQKRGLIDFVGTVHKWLYGTMDNTDRLDITNINKQRYFYLPHSSGVGSTDSGESYLLHLIDPFRRNAKTRRSPPKSDVGILENNKAMESGLPNIQAPQTNKEINMSKLQAKKSDDQNVDIHKGITELEQLCMALKNVLFQLRTENEKLKEEQHW
ncbi:uncharacterized protein LOC129619374 [Condylostylus longicornis]|uniref:uncharacterized protein LOC129619374 n=1 Tax=Condylostylus longicornis TaxID=2530218 RepID=UPI00244DDE04|nr:uncharacterized protein LOC129619374 [Condylostylus longicornis]